MYVSRFTIINGIINFEVPTTAILNVLVRDDGGACPSTGSSIFCETTASYTFNLLNRNDGPLYSGSTIFYVDENNQANKFVTQLQFAPAPNCCRSLENVVIIINTDSIAACFTIPYY